MSKTSLGRVASGTTRLLLLILFSCVVLNYAPQANAEVVELEADSEFIFNLDEAVKNFATELRDETEVRKAIESHVSVNDDGSAILLDKIHVTFDGGAISSSMTSVLQILSEAPDNVFLFVPAVDLGNKDSLLCSQLLNIVLPRVEYCNPTLIAALERLQSSARQSSHAGFVAPTNVVYLPLMLVSEDRSNISLDTSSYAEARRIENIDRNWGDIRVFGTQIPIPSVKESRLQTNRTIEVRYYDRVVWELAVHPGVPVEVRNSILQRIGTILNVSAYYSSNQADWSLPKKFASPDDVWKALDDSQPLDFEGSYNALLRSFHASEAFDTGCVEAEYGGQPRIVVIDSRVAKNPDLLLAVYSERPTTDQLASLARIQKLDESHFSSEQHHGTFVASILASHANGVGLSGIVSDSIKVTSVPFPPPVGNPEKLLSKYLESESRHSILNRPLFLLAGTFLPYATVFNEDTDKYALWAKKPDGQLTHLKNRESRFIKDVNAVITQKQLPFIVAAGQEGIGQVGTPIDARSPLAPQNIGDYDNIIAVAVCEECERGSTLWERSNFNGNDEPDVPAFVHVMAPGKDMIPGYVSENEISRTVGGSSAASAIVAGIVSKMIACHKASYVGNPRKIKQWLMLTSRPDRNPGIGRKVAAGVVDPLVSMLSPDESWLKRGQRPFEALTMSWCRRVVQLDSDDRYPTIAENSIRIGRLAKLHDGTHAMFSTWEVRRSTANNLIFQSNGNGKFSDNEPLLSVRSEQGECTLRPSEVDDLILGSPLEVANCASIAPCE